MACPIPTSHMTGPSYDPGKYFGFAPITVGNSGLCVPSCLFTSLNLPSDWETHLRLLAHYDEVFVCVCLCVCVESGGSKLVLERSAGVAKCLV